MSQTRISEVNISIWNKQQVLFQANPDVNIIMGINGSGKTTFLAICISRCLEVRTPRTMWFIFLPSTTSL